MADFGYDEFAEEAAPLPGARRVRKATNLIGAVLSVALIAGLAVWGYRIAVRDARGVPVVMALEGPMRIAPENPGGEQVAHQGLAVNNVAAVGEVAAPADRLVLAPRPVELTDGDLAGYAPIPPSAVVPTLTSTIPIPGQFADEGSSTAALEGSEEDIAAEPESATNAAQVMLAAAEPLVPGDAVAADPALDPAATAVAEAVDAAVDAALTEAVAETPVLVDATDFAVASSLVPRPRPATGAAVQPEAIGEPPAAEVELASADAVAPGTRLVQLGAYPDVAAATADWDRLTASYADYFKGKTRMVQTAVSGGKTFYRLRALGFDDEDEARRLCAVLTSDNLQCIPVLTR